MITAYREIVITLKNWAGRSKIDAETLANELKTRAGKSKIEAETMANQSGSGALRGSGGRIPGPCERMKWSIGHAAMRAVCGTP